MSQLDRQNARMRAIRERNALEDEISRSGATAEEKTFMRQHLAHLWKCSDEAMGGPECRP